MTHLIAHHCGLEAHEFIYHLGNAHIYDDHIEVLKSQVDRIPFDFPTLTITRAAGSSAAAAMSINDYKVDDFIVSDYKSHEPIKMLMRN